MCGGGKGSVSGKWCANRRCRMGGVLLRADDADGRLEGLGSVESWRHS